MMYLHLWMLVIGPARALIELHDDGICGRAAYSWSPSQETADFRNCSCVTGTRTSSAGAQQQVLSWLVSCTFDGKTDITLHASEDCNAGSIISMPLIPAGHSWSGGECVTYSEGIMMQNRSMKILDPAQVQFPQCGNGRTCLNERTSPIAVAGAATPRALSLLFLSAFSIETRRYQV